MLVMFAVENWACFRDQQVFTMETYGKVWDEFAFDTGVRQFPRLNRVSAIYGPNGGGKSRFIEAMAFMRRAVMASSTSEPEAEDTLSVVDPFCIDADCRSKPASFTMVFIQDGAVYEYGFSADHLRIHEEWLLVRPRGGRRTQRWLERDLDPSSGEYAWKFGQFLRGSRMKWRKATRPNTLFVPTAVRLGSESLRPIVEWFQNLVIVDSKAMNPSLTSGLLENPQDRERLIWFLRYAGTRAWDVRLSKGGGQVTHLPPRRQTEKVEPEHSIDYAADDAEKRRGNLVMEEREAYHAKPDGDGEVIELGFHRLDIDSLAYVDFDRQSEGTKKLYCLAGIWLEAMAKDHVLVMDDLDRNLHPELARFLLLCINRVGNEHEQRAQLVTTLHDTTLFFDALDRNQIWLSDKRRDLSVEIFALSNYRPRLNENLQLGYLSGQFGGLPVISETSTLD